MKRLLLLCILSISFNSFADELSDADDAYERGDYTTAITLYTKAAEQGDATAQVSLGLLYDVGKGTPQDYVMAHMFFNIAARGGDEKAKKGRDIVADMMTSEKILEAQQLAREWMEKY